MALVNTGNWVASKTYEVDMVVTYNQKMYKRLVEGATEEPPDTDTTNWKLLTEEEMKQMAFDENVYCDFDATATKAIAGKDIILAVFSDDGAKLMAISGQQGLTINRSADSIEVTSKDTEGGWKSKIAGMKEWSIDNDGIYVPTDETHKTLSKAFTNSDPVCVKVIDGKRKKAMFGGLAFITDYPLEAPYDDAMTYSISLEGNGALVDLTTLEGADAGKVTAWPEGMTPPTV